MSRVRRDLSIVVLAAAMMFCACNHLPGLPPVLPGPRGSVSAGASFGVTYSPARVRVSKGGSGDVVLDKNGDGRWGSETLVTTAIDPRFAASYVPLENVEVGLYAGWMLTGARVDMATSSGFAPLGLTLSLQTENPATRDTGPWSWEARGLVSAHPNAGKNWRYLVAVGGSLGDRRHSFFDDELAEDVKEGPDFTFRVATPPWKRELQVTRSETRVEGAVGLSTSRFPGTGLIVAVQPYWVVRAGDAQYRAVSGLDAEFGEFQLAWGAALTLTVFHRNPARP